MTSRVEIAGLRIDPDLAEFVRHDALPGTDLGEDEFWRGTAAIVRDLTPKIESMLNRRQVIQAALDQYHGRMASDHRPEEYRLFLQQIGYLLDEPEDFTIATSSVDDEIAIQAGPQLVVPVTNARFAVNAANARWGSLYDALYGTDVIPQSTASPHVQGYDPERGALVIARGRSFLDAHFPLVTGSHRDASEFLVDEHGYGARIGADVVRLREPDCFVGFAGPSAQPESILLVHHGLHVEIQIDRSHPIGAGDAAGVRDIVLESAVTVIMDLEDSVSTVDAADKVLAYRNWLGLVAGELSAPVTKNGRTFTRVMNGPRRFLTSTGDSVVLPGNALLFVRHVGHLMFTEAVLDEEGRPIPEGILDAVVTGLCGVHDVRGPKAGRNSRAGAIYVVKPKLHGPEEVALACELFSRTEQLLHLPPNTIKIGLMDEERRTSVNLKACIFEAMDRIAFVNTGFLDRTGDEIRTSTMAGPMVRKADMKTERWIHTYEDQNVDIGLACGFRGRAQIGKGMWAAPDNLADMVEQKIAHPLAGANCAWVPSPTAATLHALHYHMVDVKEVQKALAAGGPRTNRSDLLCIPLGDPTAWSASARREELDNNVQSTLGYVVKWVNSGVGCSKVPDIHGTPLMEDRATCRISSQLVANWLVHGIVTVSEVEESLRRMAEVVDGQNRGEPDYEPMAPSFDGEAFRAARDLLLHGTDQTNGYTEPILHAHRIAKKALLAEK